MRHVAHIARAHNYLRIFGFYGEFLAQVITPFCKAHLFKVGKVPVPGVRNKTTWKVTHVFARSNFDKTEYRIPSSLLKEFLDFAQHRGYNPTRIQVFEEPELFGLPASFEFQPGYENTRPGQDEWVNYQLAPGPIKINNASTGYGKALAVDTPVRTINGWVPIGNLQVDDLVMTQDGSHTYVTGVYPQGRTETYIIILEDGRNVTCCPEHQWEVRTAEGGFHTLTTQQMVESGKTYYLPLVDSERKAPRNEARNMYKVGFEDQVLSEKYLEGSTVQRLELLQGLMDNRGYVEQDGTLTYTTEYPRTASFVQQLVWSLGGIAELNSTPRLSNVYIKFPYPEMFFTRPERVSEARGHHNPDLALKIVSINRGMPQETCCISVEHPSKLYVVKDYVVTHNTYMALRTMLLMGTRTLITVQPRYVTTWLKALGDILKLAPEDVLLWEQDLSRLPGVLASGAVNPKIIILTMTRIDVYLRNEKKDPDAPDLDTLYKSLGCGLRIIDEGHEAIHQVCISLMYGNFPKLLLLSATLTADDPFINKIYKIMFPVNIRLKEPEPENYIDIVAYLYDINPRRYNLKTMQFGSYNDLTWEDSILKNEVTTRFYYDVAKKAYEDYYLDVREPGTKCLFFFSKVNMCDVMLSMFQKDYPGEDFVTFHGEDTKGKNADKLKYLKHENVITTPGSCGTGKDIDGLVTVICFHTVSSIQRNKQMIGRLRDKVLKMFDGRVRPRFVFAVCISQPKHKEYYQKRKVAFEPKKHSFKTIDSNCALE
jgi:hypothetical protein